MAYYAAGMGLLAVIWTPFWDGFLCFVGAMVLVGWGAWCCFKRKGEVGFVVSLGVLAGACLCGALFCVLHSSEGERAREVRIAQGKPEPKTAADFWLIAAGWCGFGSFCAAMVGLSRSNARQRRDAVAQLDAVRRGGLPVGTTLAQVIHELSCMVMEGTIDAQLVPEVGKGVWLYYNRPKALPGWGVLSVDCVEEVVRRIEAVWVGSNLPELRWRAAYVAADAWRDECCRLNETQPPLFVLMLHVCMEGRMLEVCHPVRGLGDLMQLGERAKSAAMWKCADLVRATGEADCRVVEPYPPPVRLRISYRGMVGELYVRPHELGGGRVNLGNRLFAKPQADWHEFEVLEMELGG